MKVGEHIIFGFRGSAFKNYTFNFGLPNRCREPQIKTFMGAQSVGSKAFTCERLVAGMHLRMDSCTEHETKNGKQQYPTTATTTSAAIAEVGKLEAGNTVFNLPEISYLTFPPDRI